MNRIEIDTEIKLECYIAYAEISVPARRYLLPVLLHVRDMWGDADAKSLSSELFPGMEPVSRRLLEICEREELVEEYDGTYHISRAGEDAIGDDKVFVRNPGRMYKMYYADSAIIPKENRVVRLDPDPEGAGYDPQKTVEVCDLPRHMEDLERSTLKPLFGCMRDEFRIDSIHRRAKELEPDRMALLLRLVDGSMTDPDPYEGGGPSISGRFRVSAEMAGETREMPERDGSITLPPPHEEEAFP